MVWRLNLPAVPRQFAIYVTGCLLVGGSLGLTMHRNQPVHSAGDYLYSLSAPSPYDSRPTYNDWLTDLDVAALGLSGSAEAAVAATSLAPGPSPAPAEARPQIVEYTIQEGDTIWGIAAAHGTDEDSILSLNEVRPSAIQIGTKLKVPNFKGAVYKVESGDTISEIASAYGISPDDILKHNGIPDASGLQVGQVLLLPGARLQPSVRNQVASRGVSRSRWVWPISGGQVSSEYGPRWGGQHNGLDIAVPTGTPVGAARAGEVTHAGWDGNYGLSVIIDHGDGTQTRYAHASSVAVNVGDWVNAGDMIMRVGSTGYSTGPHLHFEVLVNGVPQNPRAYLP